MTRKQAGQGTVETLILFTTLTLVFKGGLMLFWLLIGNLWLDHQLYQHLICRAQGQKEIFCMRQLLTETKKLILKESIKNIHVSQERRGVWKGSLNWKIFKVSVPITQTLKLP